MEASAPGARSGDEDRSPFALPNFRRLWSAFALSVTGYAIGNTTLLWLVFDRTHDPYAIALLGIAGFVPVLLFGVFAGALADRYERRRLMITADLVRAACIGALPITYLVVGFSLPIVLAIVFVLEAFGALFRPASNSLLPQVVPARKLDAANGYLQAANSGGGSIGSLVAGALIALVGAIAGLALNSVTFVASALLLSLIVVPFPPRSPADDASRPARRSLRQDVAEGVAFLRGQRGLLYGTFAGTALNFFSTLAAQFLVVYVSAGLGGGGLEFGALMAAFTLGIMVGALTASSLHLAPRLGRVVVAVSVLAGLGIATLALLPPPVAVALVLIGVGFGVGALNTAFFTAVQRMVPNAVLGRYLSLDEVGSLAAVPAAQILGAVAIERLGISLTYLLAGVGFMSVGFVAALVRPLRDLSDTPIAWTPDPDRAQRPNVPPGPAGAPEPRVPRRRRP